MNRAYGGIIQGPDITAREDSHLRGKRAKKR